MKKITVLILTFLLVSGIAFSQESAPKWGWGFNAGMMYPFTDYEAVGPAPMGELSLRYNLNPKMFVSLGAGMGFLSDGFFDDAYNFNTSMLGADVRLNIVPFTLGKMKPFVSVGGGAFSFTYNSDKKTSDKIETIAEDGYVEITYGVGGGFSLPLSNRLNLDLFADYRFTTGDELDGHDSNSPKIPASLRSEVKDGFLKAGLGLTFALGKGQEEPEDDLLAMEGVEFSELLDESPQADDADLSMFVDDLDSESMGQPEASELNQQISQKESEVQALQADLDFKEQRITDLELELQRAQMNAATAGSGSFSDKYQASLQLYNKKDYQAAIVNFRNLVASEPNNKLSSNCDYWIGESFYGLKEYTQAIDAFNKVLGYSQSYKKDDALMMLGLSYYNMGDMANARTYFQRLLNQYPDSEYVTKAQRWLNKIG